MVGKWYKTERFHRIIKRSGAYTGFSISIPSDEHAPVRVREVHHVGGQVKGCQRGSRSQRVHAPRRAATHFKI